MREKINALACAGQPFLFIIDFDRSSPLIFKMDNKNIPLFQIDKFRNFEQKTSTKKPKITKKEPMTFDDYLVKFEALREEIKSGNTYMANLTSQTKIELDGSLEEIFYSSNAQFKLLTDRFVVFSPERFVKIDSGKIFTYPMKGTCKANDVSLEELMKSKKEHAEHTMVVDLLRNDLSIVAKNVRVENFRIPIKIKAGKSDLYQIISEISGELDSDFKSRLGDIIYELLPAGSISGAPKKKTLEVLKQIEGYDRGYFSGVFGYFDGANLDSAVMIRYIEKTTDGYVYKSGGGVTIDSDARSEYEEMLAKIYLPCL